MRKPLETLVALAGMFYFALSCCAQETIPQGMILIGAKTSDEPEAITIQVVSPEGKRLKTLFHRREGSISMGRLSSDGRQLAFDFESQDQKPGLWLLKGGSEASQIADGGGYITAWSPDGMQLGLYGKGNKPGSYESFVIDLKTKARHKLDLPLEYIAEDWHPRDNLRTAIYWNSRNLLYREMKGDHYPTRQLDLLMSNGQTRPLTKDPCTDNIWSRFSPTGDRLAYYQRRIIGEIAKEYAVVSLADGSKPRVLLCFTDSGQAKGLPWFRPRGFPAWSPDGKTIAWLINTNEKPEGQGEKWELLFIDVERKEFRRLSLTEKRYTWVSAIEWH